MIQIWRGKINKFLAYADTVEVDVALILWQCDVVFEDHVAPTSDNHETDLIWSSYTGLKDYLDLYVFWVLSIWNACSACDIFLRL